MIEFSQSTILQFYLKHKGILINLLSVFTFLGLNKVLGSRGINNLQEAPWLAAFFLVFYFLELPATYYSMGAFNERRRRAGIKPILLHRWMNMGPWQSSFGVDVLLY